MAKAKEKKIGDSIEIQVPEVLQGQKLPEFQDAEAEAKFPLLMSLMTPAKDARHRTTWEASKLSFGVRQGFLRVTVVCPTRQVQTVITLASLIGCMEHIEAAIATGELLWEQTYDLIKEEKSALKEAKKLMRKTP